MGLQRCIYHNKLRRYVPVGSIIKVVNLSRYVVASHQRCDRGARIDVPSLATSPSSLSSIFARCAAFHAFILELERATIRKGGSLVWFSVFVAIPEAPYIPLSTCLSNNQTKVDSL